MYLKEEIQHDREKGQIDARAAPQKILRSLRNESLKERKKEKRDIITQDDDKNVTFSATRSPRNAIEGDLLIFPYTNPSDNSNLWIQGRLACRFDRLEDALKSDWKTNRFKI